MNIKSKSLQFVLSGLFNKVERHEGLLLGKKHTEDWLGMHGYLHKKWNDSIFLELLYDAIKQELETRKEETE